MTNVWKSLGASVAIGVACTSSAATAAETAPVSIVVVSCAEDMRSKPAIRLHVNTPDGRYLPITPKVTSAMAQRGITKFNFRLQNAVFTVSAESPNCSTPNPITFTMAGEARNLFLQTVSAFIMQRNSSGTSVTVFSPLGSYVDIVETKAIDSPSGVRRPTIDGKASYFEDLNPSEYLLRVYSMAAVACALIKVTPVGAHAQEVIRIDAGRLADALRAASRRPDAHLCSVGDADATMIKTSPLR